VHWCSAGAWRCSRRTFSASPPGPAPLAGTTAGGESPPSLVTRAAPPPTRPTIPDELDPFLPPLPRPPNPLVSVSLSPALLSLALALLAWRREKEKARSGLGLVCLAGFFLTRRGGGGYKNLRGARGRWGPSTSYPCAGTEESRAPGPRWTTTLGGGRGFTDIFVWGRWHVNPCLMHQVTGRTSDEPYPSVG
jgi:hypothetical protein